MFDVTLIYRDYQRFTVEVDDNDFDEFMAALSNNRPYLNKEKSLGFWLPPDAVRCAYIKKKESQCPPSLDENQSPNPSP